MGFSTRLLQSEQQPLYTPPRPRSTLTSSGSAQGLFKVISFCALALTASPAALAQEARPRRVEIGAIDIVGEVQKPQVEYIITRRSPEDDEQLRLQESFIPRILQSVEKKPF